MITLKEYKKDFFEALKNDYPSTEIDTFFMYLIEEYLGFKRIDIVLNPNFLIDDKKKVFFDNALKKLRVQEPIQYILGKTEFFGFPFIVDKNTLIPRPETEELVEWILDEVKILQKSTTKEIAILDIGTGSGCIPISLSSLTKNTIISAIDISKGALEIAKKNTQINHVTIDFFELDILKTTSLHNIKKQNNSENQEIKFDIIVSNPPYVRELEKNDMKKNVLENEPHLALFVTDKNPLVFYEKIANLSKIHLHKNGILFFEINQYLAKETMQMLSEKGFTNIELRKDIFGNDRMIRANF